MSLGYKVDLEEVPGVWQGQAYDAVQRNIVINHLAIVRSGRAGNARLNLDRLDAVSFTPEKEINMDPKDMGTIRLDNGLTYQASPEVVVEFEKLRSERADHQSKLDTQKAEMDKVAAERDTLKAEVAKIPQLKADALEAAKADAKARIALEAVADSFKVDHAGKTDRQV